MKNNGYKYQNSEYKVEKIFQQLTHLDPPKIFPNDNHFCNACGGKKSELIPLNIYCQRPILIQKNFQIQLNMYNII